MREIKFRGKRIDNGEWVYGFGIKASLTESIIYDNNKLEWVEVIPKTIGQYTGLEDKNGKEIYEGDIVKYNSTFEEFNYIWIVVFKDGAFKLEYKDALNAIGYALLINWAEDIEVIGNIYDKFKNLEE